MSVQIIINGESATESLKELSALAAGFGAAPSEVALPQAPTYIQDAQQAGYSPSTKPTTAPPSAPIQAQMVPVQPTPAPVTAPAAVPAQQYAPPAQVPATQIPTVVPTGSAPSYSMEQLAVAATPFIEAGRSQELINWMQQYGAQALTQLPKEHYGNFATYLRSLGAQI